MVFGEALAGLCFWLMPLAILRLFHRKQIGYVLNGWFLGLAASLFVCGLYSWLHLSEYFGIVRESYLAAVNVLRGMVLLSATIFLLWRDLYLEKHPEAAVGSLEAALQDLRKFLAEHGHESRKPEQRES